MIDILSLPRRNRFSTGGLAKQAKTGLPINSLPGWELIPLNCKLPMLKCPGNQVIFSKDKIGNSFKCSMQDFDNSTTLNLPEYNPLHDSNLKTFYANERNLKRLRENGEITNENEVICNLKDFNQYREDLHKAQLYHVLQAYRQREAERHDRLLIANAEGISRRDDIMHSDRQHMHEDVIARKRAHEEAHHKRMVELYELSLQRIKRVRWFYKVMYMSIEHQRAVSNMKIKEHLGIYQDLQRKHLIKLKKLFQFKKDRYNRQMRNLQKQREQKHSAVQFQSWQLRLNARIDNQRRIEMLLAEIGEEREEFIERHKARYQEKWNRIQEEIKERSHRNKLMKQRKQHKKTKSKSKKKKAAAMMKRMMVQPSFCDEYRDVFEGLLDSELCYAMNAAIQMEGHSPLTFTSDDPIYKAAQYILNYILNDLNIDLSDDLCAKSVLIARIDNFLCDATKYVNYKAVQIIGFARESNSMPAATPKTSSHKTHRGSHVSFKGVACTIGMGSYEIHPFVDIRPCSERRPTPAGSLTSLVVGQVQEQAKQTPALMPHLTRSEVVFIEYYFVKFKRELLVGVDKQVFAAIQCHFENRIMDVREELLELDSQFLFNQIAVGILSYPVNPLNFETALILAISVLASKIIWELQQSLLKPGIDPRATSHPISCGTERERELRAFCST